MPHTTYYLDSDQRIDSEVDDSRMRRILKSKSGVLWVNIAEPNVDDQRLLLDEFGFHPLAVDTCVDPAHGTARVEDYGEYLFINARGIDYTVDKDVLQIADLSMFLGPNYVVTVHNIDMPSVEAIRKLVEVDGRPLARGAAFLAHAHLDALIHVIVPTLDRMSERAAAIEEQILDHADSSVLAALMTLKRSSLGLNRALAPQREVLSRLGRREFDLIGDGADLYFRDLYDDLVRVHVTNDTIRERADTSLATYLSAVANRQNETMKILSMVATIFMPLTLIAGIFGMNFQNMPALESLWIYYVIWALTVGALLLMLWMLWLKRWNVVGRFVLRRRQLGRFVPTAVEPAWLTAYLGRAAARNLRRGSAVKRTYQKLGRYAHLTQLIGSNTGNLRNLVNRYLPKPAIDRKPSRMAKLLKVPWSPVHGKSRKDRAITASDGDQTP